MSRPIDPHAELRTAIAARRVVLIAGTGVSTAATGARPEASWGGLLKNGLEWLRDHDLIRDDKARAHLALMDDADAATHHFISAAQDVTRLMGGPGSVHYRTWLKSTVGRLTVKRDAGIRALDRLRAHGNLLATTNYDSLLLGDGLTPVTWDQSDDFLGAVRNKQIDKVLFLHGHWRRPHSVVLDWSSYNRIARDEQFRNDLLAFWQLQVWVYIGCGPNGLADPDLGLLLDRYGSRMRNAELWDYCLVRHAERDAFQAHFDERELNIVAVPFGDDHDDLPTYLASLAPTEATTELKEAAGATGARPRVSPPDFCAQPDYLGGHDFIGRRSEIDLLDDWARPADPTNLLLFEAIGGNGKSMLTWTWITEHAPVLRNDWAGRFWYSFYERGAVMSDFCRHALSYMTGESFEVLKRTRTADLVPALIDELHARPWLLVLDGLERVLVAYHRYDAATVPDETADRPIDVILDRNPTAAIRDEDEDLLRLLAGARPSKILVTSRLTPRALLNPADQPIPGAKRVPLGGLRPDDAEAMFRATGAYGVPDDIRRYLTENCDNHPLMIGVLAGLVVNYLPARGDFDAWAADTGPGGGGRLNLAELNLIQRRNHILKAAFEDLPKPSQELLATLALFPGSIDYEALMAVNPLLPPEPERPLRMTLLDRQTAAEQKSSYEQELELWRRSDDVRDAGQRLADAVRNLEKRGLLQYDHVSRRYDLHPVVRGVAFGGLQPAELKRHGQRLVDLFTAAPHAQYENAQTLEDVTPGLNLARTLLKLGRHQAAATAIHAHGLDLALNFNLEEHHETLALLRPVFGASWADTVDLSPNNVISVSTSAGNALWPIGDHDGARVAHGLALKTALDTDDWRRALFALRNLIRDLDDHPAKQLELAHLSLALSTDLNEPPDVFRSRLFLFELSTIVGEWEAVAAFWRDLDPMGRDWPRGMYTPGDAEMLYAFGAYYQGSLEERHLTVAAELATASQNRSAQRNIHRLRGLWRLDQEEWALAATSFAEAVRMARERRIEDWASEAGLVLSKLKLATLTTEEARQEALRLQTSPVPQVLLARIWLELGETSRATETALAAYRHAWADGEPYVYRFSLMRAAELLEELGVAVPQLAPHDPSNDTTFPWEADIRAEIERRRSISDDPNGATSS